MFLPHCRKKNDLGKRKAVQQRIRRVQDAIQKAEEYLETGKHASWQGFRPLFVDKFQDGKSCPPHKDWVKNVFIPRCKRTLRHAEKVLRRWARSTS